MTLNQAFQILARASNPRDAKVVLNSIQGKSFLRFRIHFAARKLRRGVPVAKIVGKKWFYGMEFETSRHTLDPRPDSETLVEAVLENKNNKNMKILDLGTGTGCLICSIVKNIPGATGVGIDISRAVIRIARRNVKRHGLEDRVKILRGNFNNLNHKSEIINQKFDIIISNPPYIAIGDLRVDAGAMHDPKIALYAGADGLDAYRAIAKSAREHLAPGGKIFLEIGAGQGDAVREVFTRNEWQFVGSYDDLSEIERVLVFK
ncbi:MAG: peptide chain release factor N(5)-glutamine methyltransferase [Alphaproteobacteria bacterium]|nr:peptide chain release factor N(5)-glutamine methyltransferase [Alphaproteobacteria bacterium]MCL2890166.1 peptide chain release factor N(5)-glutamine methyltransferase [Alphaproteobacteria bacterium]